MVNIKLPYYNENMRINISEKNLKAVLHPKIHEFFTDLSEKEIVRQALDYPIGTQKLCELSKGKNRVVVVTSDHTRSMPSKITLPILLEEIRKGNPDADITILIATGLHRKTTKEEQKAMFGDAIVDKEKIVCHDAKDKQNMRYVCQLPSGSSFEVNKLVIETDLLITEGFVEPHFFAGFSGGRKSILPGVCSEITIRENHCAKAIAHKSSRGGILKGNEINEDMIYAAKKVNVQFTLNVALDAQKKIIAAYAGDIIESHAEACKFVNKLSSCDKVIGDIVVTSNGGYPLDQNLYQSPKAMTTARSCAGEDGIIIMVSSCCDGLGGTEFERLMLSGPMDKVLKKILATPAKETLPEQWCVQVLADIMQKHKIILVTTFLDHEIVKKVGMIPASNPDEALEIAYGLKSRDASVVVIPDGVATMINEKNA